LHRAVQNFHPDLRHAKYLPRALIGARTLPVIRFAQRLRKPDPHVPVVQVSPTASVRTYEPTGGRRSDAALLWIHGGGMVMGNAAQDDRFCRLLADEVGIFVASIDYRLAPEDPYPAPVDDCMAGLRWLAEQPQIDRARVAVGGMSAGGGLAAGVALRARDEGGPALAFQLLTYPMLDDRTTLRRDLDARAERSKMRMWSPNSNRYGWSAYLNGAAGGPDIDHCAAPARAADLTGLPSTWIGVGTNDLFHDEDVEYARRLREAGVDCRLDVVAGGYHSFDLLEASAPVSRRFRAHQIAALKDGLGI
jgi:acetyl esterase/lipase